MRRTWLTRIPTLVLLLTTSLAAGARDAEPERSVAPRIPHAKPERSVISEHEDPRMLVLKFHEAANVKLENGRFVSQAEGVAEVDALVARHGFKAESKFSQSPERLRTLVELARESGSHEVASLGLYFDLLQSKPDTRNAESLLDALNALAVVEIAYAEPIVVPAAPDYTQAQYYKFPAPTGVDTEWAHTRPGGRGQWLLFYNVELGTYFGHDDLEFPDDHLISGENSQDHWKHGTAVFGVVRGNENGSGVTGMAPMVFPRQASPCREVDPHGWCTGYSTAEAILDAADHAVTTYGKRPFAMILIEVQTGEDQRPIEVYPAVFDAIRTAVGLNITVIEAAGNGGRNLDLETDADGNALFDGSPARDSGAIMVGAGCPPESVPVPEPCSGARTAVYNPEGWSSNYGERVDVQGWGAGVVTSGYGDLQGGPYDGYTAVFNGTSSASAVVAGTVASLHGMVLEASGVPAIPPKIMRQLLKFGGSPQPPQDAAERPIGPLPDIRNAWDVIHATWGSLSIEAAEAEEGGVLRFRISLAHALINNVFVNWSLEFQTGATASQDDFPPLSNSFAYGGTVMIPAYATEVFVEIPTRQDTLSEGTEHVELHIGSSGAGSKDSRAKGFILDDDQGQIWKGSQQSP